MFKRKQRRKGSLAGSDMPGTPHSAMSHHGSVPNSAATSRCEGDVFTFDGDTLLNRKGNQCNVTAVVLLLQFIAEQYGCLPLVVGL